MKDDTTKNERAGEAKGEELSTIFTRKASCRDCYRCLRLCPVKAIRLQGEQATVVPELCIACGRCIRECPQGAKSFRRDTEKVRRWIAKGLRVAASVAPSFAGLFTEWESRRFASALRRLGFSRVEETAVGAWMVAHNTANEAGASGACADNGAPASPIICSACPAVVRFVEVYRPDQAEMLAGAVSPMLAHGRLLKEEGKVDRVVFIGPCVAKKDEAQLAEDRPIDAVLTFIELLEWLRETDVELAKLEESDFDRDPDGAAAARLFPLEGGLARTAGLETDMLDQNLLAISGIEDLVTALDGLRSDPQPVVIEPLICSGGCMNGPVVPADSPSLLVRRRRLIAWAARPASEDAPPRGGDPEMGVISLTRGNHGGFEGLVAKPDEDEIERVLSEVGKASPEERLDCGACGYDTCRDKAIAIIRGMAEKEMCIPHMRRLAEQRTDRVIESSPNGIVILDERLRILHTNAAFRSFFVCSDAVLGKPISYLVDPAPFERVRDGTSQKEELTIHHEAYQLVCRQLIYCLPEDRQVVGLFVNLTDMQANEKQMEKLRQETQQQARELLEHQIGMAQKMAMFLGENTALGEELVHKLLKLAGADTPGQDPFSDAAAAAATAGRGRGRGRGSRGSDDSDPSSGGGGFI